MELKIVERELDISTHDKAASRNFSRNRCEARDIPLTNRLHPVMADAPLAAIGITEQA